MTRQSATRSVARLGRLNRLFWLVATTIIWTYAVTSASQAHHPLAMTQDLTLDEAIANGLTVADVALIGRIVAIQPRLTALGDSGSVRADVTFLRVTPVEWLKGNIPGGEFDVRVPYTIAITDLPEVMIPSQPDQDNPTYLIFVRMIQQNVDGTMVAMPFLRCERIIPGRGVIQVDVGAAERSISAIRKIALRTDPIRARGISDLIIIGKPVDDSTRVCYDASRRVVCRRVAVERTLFGHTDRDTIETASPIGARLPIARSMMFLTRRAGGVYMISSLYCGVRPIINGHLETGQSVEDVAAKLTTQK